MVLRYCIILLVNLFISLTARAVNVGQITSIMTFDTASLAKEITNTTDSARFITVSIERIASPMEAGGAIPVESKSELLFTPASLIMPGNTKEYFRFIYGGPDDERERYYRLTWTDEPVTEYDPTLSKKIGHATTSAIIRTILVVAPRNERFAYKYHGDAVTNVGNVSFRVISFGPCKSKERERTGNCRERYYIMPGKSVNIKYVDFSDRKSRIGIWHNNKYTSVK